MLDKGRCKAVVLGRFQRDVRCFRALAGTVPHFRMPKKGPSSGACCAHDRNPADVTHRRSACAGVDGPDRRDARCPGRNATDRRQRPQLHGCRELLADRWQQGGRRQRDPGLSRQGDMVVLSTRTTDAKPSRSATIALKRRKSRRRRPHSVRSMSALPSIEWRTAGNNPFAIIQRWLRRLTGQEAPSNRCWW